tara:strand:+ start:472 stop:714 length:243 start_codon:yes stop_codon:yes gene_type:complete
MRICPWKEILDFKNLSEFTQFTSWMEEQVDSGKAKELEVEIPYAGSTAFKEKWFCHISSGTVWRIVWPDPPFTGVFEKIK